MKLPKLGQQTAEAIHSNGEKLTAAIWVLSGLILVLIAAVVTSRHVVVTPNA